MFSNENIPIIPWLIIASFRLAVNGNTCLTSGLAILFFMLSIVALVKLSINDGEGIIILMYEQLWE
jgi:hypothetical protein